MTGYVFFGLLLAAFLLVQPIVYLATCIEERIERRRVRRAEARRLAFAKIVSRGMSGPYRRKRR